MNYEYQIYETLPSFPCFHSPSPHLMANYEYQHTNEKQIKNESQHEHQAQGVQEGLSRRGVDRGGIHQDLHSGENLESGNNVIGSFVFLSEHVSSDFKVVSLRD